MRKKKKKVLSFNLLTLLGYLAILEIYAAEMLLPLTPPNV